MYRQVALHDSDKHFHRILWRDSPDQPIGHYRMTRVTYGVGCSAFLSIRALQELGSSLEPTIAQIIHRDFYVDDLLSGGCSVDQAIVLQDKLIQGLSSGE